MCMCVTDCVFVKFFTPVFPAPEGISGWCKLVHKEHIETA